MQLKKIGKWLDERLVIDNIGDYSNNGIQVEAGSEVSKVAFAVDSSLVGFKKAVDAGAELIVVHHGLFWGKLELVRGFYAERLKFLLQNNLSLYAAHLPLDIHPELGNDVCIVEAAGFEVNDWFAPEMGSKIGCAGVHKSGLKLVEVKKNLKEYLGNDPVATILAEDDEMLVRSVGTVTGGGLKYGIQAATYGVDLFITGEMSHAWYHPILEVGLPTLMYGHYSTEKTGIKRLQDDLAKQLNLPTVFIDIPTGM